VSDERYAIALLPPGELDDDTELAFVDGKAFVAATKHELVVDMLIGRLEAQGRTIRLLLVVDGALALLVTLMALL
jgi:hypothetical protein